MLAAPGKVARVRHHPALPYAELPAFMSELREREGIAARALEFAILTAARTGEIIGATWDEIDLTTKVWAIGAERMKAGREHRVPLSDRAMKILQTLPREGGNVHLFVGAKKGRSISTMAMSDCLRALRREFTVHGFRSTFRDWAAEKTIFPHEVCEQALAHTIPNASERAYRRGDLFEKRRRLMDAWARYCSTKPADDDAKVVAMVRR
jgi:integrase